MPPYQFRFEGLEEGFHCSIVIAITFAAHGYLEALLSQQLLIIMRTILAAPVGMVDAALGWSAQGDGHVQRPDREVAFHPVRHGPADYPPGIQIQNHGQIEPALTGPDIAYINDPFLIGLICREVPVQQVWRDIEVVIAVCSHLVFMGSDDRYSVLAE